MKKKKTTSKGRGKAGTKTASSDRVMRDVLESIEHLEQAAVNVREKERLHEDEVFKLLESIRRLDDKEKQKRDLDRLILVELRMLAEKLQMARTSPPPSPDLILAILQEIFLLLLKLVAKLWILQNMDVPEVPKPQPDQGPAT